MILTAAYYRYYEPNSAPYLSPMRDSFRWTVSGDALRSLQCTSNVRTTHGLCLVRHAIDMLLNIHVYLNDIISFSIDAPAALLCLTEVLDRLSSFGLQFKARKCTFMQTEMAFLSHIVGRSGLACDPEKLSAVWT